MRHILSLYDLLNGDGVGGGNILKKAFIDAMLQVTGTSNTPDLPTEHSNDRRHFVCIVHALCYIIYGRASYIHTAWGLRCSFFGKGKFEGLSDGTGNNEGSTLSIHSFILKLACVVFKLNA